MQENVKNQRPDSDLNQEMLANAFPQQKMCAAHRPQVTIFVTQKLTIPDSPLFPTRP
jgi:hypothetical protein